MHNLYPQSTIDDFIRDLEDSLSAGTVTGTWILVDGQELIGSASILKQDMTTNTDLSPWLANVFIRPGYRGRGLGRFLIRDIMDKAAESGLSWLYLFTEDQAQFYQKLGWKIIRQEEYNKAQVSIMSVNLKERR